MNRLRTSILLASVIALAACGGADSRGGAIPLGLAGPPNARAVMFRIVGQHDTVTVPAGKTFKMFISRSADTTSVVVTATSGNVLSGAIALVQVADLHVLPTFTVVQVAATTYSQLPDTAYTIHTLASAQ
jgi:hypothetical protein